MAASSNLICQQWFFIPLTHLSKYIPISTKTTNLLSLPSSPTLCNFLTTIYIGLLVLISMSFAGWLLDWRDPHESCVDHKIRIVFPDHRKRRDYMLKKIEELDALEARRKVLMKILADAVDLERDYEMLG